MKHARTSQLRSSGSSQPCFACALMLLCRMADCRPVDTRSAIAHMLGFEQTSCMCQDAEALIYKINIQVEAELQQLDKAEAAEYLQSLGVEGGGLKSLIRATYSQLGLLTFFTTGTLPASCLVHAGLLRKSMQASTDPNMQPVACYVCLLA